MTTSDLAALASIGTQLEEIVRRVTLMAEQFGATPDSAVAVDLFALERSLLGAKRAVQRATQTLERMA